MTNEQLMMLTIEQLHGICEAGLLSYGRCTAYKGNDALCAAGFGVKMANRNYKCPGYIFGFGFDYGLQSRLGIIPHIAWERTCTPQDIELLRETLRRVTNRPVRLVQNLATMKAYFPIPDPNDNLSWQKTSCVAAIQLMRGLVKIGLTVPHSKRAAVALGL